MTNRIYDRYPTRFELAEHVISALEHEVREQMGLKPHETHDPKETK